MTLHPGWSVVIPVKMLDTAKSRLAGGAVDPGALALAFFEDTLAAACAAGHVREVIVASADARVQARARAAGALVVDDRDHPGINAAAAWAAQHRSLAGGVAVVVSDLPCLTPGALDAALVAAGPFRAAFLTDLEGAGTTMWFGSPGAEVRTCFGPGSRSAHGSAGDVDLVAAGVDDARLAPARCDVDTREALEQAAAIGLGSATRSVLAAAGHR